MYNIACVRLFTWFQRRALLIENIVFPRETRVQSQVKSYQSLKKWYLIPPCLTHSIIRIKWSNQGKGVAPYLTPRYSSYWKESFRVTLEYGRQIIISFLLNDTVIKYFMIFFWILGIHVRNRYSLLDSLLLAATLFLVFIVKDLISVRTVYPQFLHE